LFGCAFVDVGSSSVPLSQAIAVDNDLHLAPDRFNTDPGQIAKILAIS
jgi:hypothetical protein